MGSEAGLETPRAESLAAALCGVAGFPVIARGQSSRAEAGGRWLLVLLWGGLQCVHRRGLSHLAVPLPALLLGERPEACHVHVCDRVHLPVPFLSSGPVGGGDAEASLVAEPDADAFLHRDAD